MSTSIKALLLSAILIVAVSAFGQVNIINFDFGAVPVQCSSWGFAYEGPVLQCASDPASQNFNAAPGFGWILGGDVSVPAVPPGIHANSGSGLTGPDTLFFPPPFNGLPFNQALFLQDTGSFAWQSVGGFSAGTYTLSFYLGSRFIDCCGYDGNQTVVALIDGAPVGTWALSSYTPFTLETVNFTVSAGASHAVEFMGTNPGDHTAFLSYVTIAPRGH